ncbi:hypothetical protein RJT34_13051 [Clitoria ternatea]|uniref:Conserved oligomeric Golgi complex subunit 5 helical domain-containing protein n=1 Tax=Clitoria ternatea TaxID=43366 RepID=A0AAN9JMX5_CLITE
MEAASPSVNIVNEELNWVRETKDWLRNEAMKILEHEMERLNHVEFGTGLLMFYSLGEADLVLVELREMERLRLEEGLRVMKFCG